MNKYWAIFKISLQQEFVYKVNFIMWRLRNVFQIVITFFLWDTIFSGSEKIILGYSKSEILTYIFAIMIVRAIVLSARAVDVSNDIAEGNLSNHLLKPINYFKYWLTRDISSKFLNLSVASIEFTVLFLVFRPSLFFQLDPVSLLVFIVAILMAAAIYFCILFLISSVPFWAPELGWGSFFLVNLVLLEFLSGLVFPIDVLPSIIQKIIMLLPFPYLIFFPIQVFLGKITGVSLIQGFIIATFWVITLSVVLRHVWNKGLKQYQAFGR